MHALNDLSDQNFKILRDAKNLMKDDGCSQNGVEDWICGWVGLHHFLLTMIFWWFGNLNLAHLKASRTPIRNLGSGYTTSKIHQNPFGGDNQWGTLTVAPAFTPSLYIPLQAVTSTPIYTMEVNSYSRRIEKFSGRPGTISLREFKAIFLTVVCELKFKYGVNYTDAFAFKQLACYVQYEALDVYKQHFPRILGII
jgi:hypothetical protein